MLEQLEHTAEEARVIMEFVDMCLRREEEERVEAERLMDEQRAVWTGPIRW